MSETLLTLENNDSLFIITRKKKGGNSEKSPGWAYKLIRKKKDGNSYQCKINRGKYEIVASMEEKDAIQECYDLISDAYFDKALMKYDDNQEVIS